MRYIWGIFVLLSTVVLYGAETEVPQSPESHAVLFYKYLKALPPNEAYFYRGLSYYNYKDVERHVKTMKFWINNLHLEVDASFPVEVPGSKGLLFAIDLRDYGWNSASFSAIARREPYFVEPAVDSATAILLRDLIKIKQDPKTFHVEALVRADWFFRETMESDRSTSYYDALFAKLRFKRGEPEWKKDEKGEYIQFSDGTWASYRPIKFENFPKNEGDFERVFAVDKFREHLKEFKIDTRHGAVVEGMEKGVSIVARQNRLVERTITSTGTYYKTFDVKETAGKSDFAETLNKDFVFDAGEILADLPAGGMAALLVNNKGDIVEVADNRFAIDTSDLKFDSRVRTPGSCFICHEQKYIKPQNLVEDMLKAGVDIKFKRREDKIAARGFFLNWIDKLEEEQRRFTRFIERTSGFKPGENSSRLKSWRDEYDSPVTLAVAAKELGTTELDFKRIAINSTKARILMLIRGLSIPRKTWEIDGYREMIRQRDALK